MRLGSRLLPLLVVILAGAACGVFEELDPRTRFGTRPELPPGVTVPQDFNRRADGFADDIPAAFRRFQVCIDDVGEALGDPGLTDMADSDRELYKMLCSEAAGNGWTPGNRADEARLLNQQALETTKCIRGRGWDYPDPVPEEFGRFLEVPDPTTLGILPETEAEAEMLIRDVAECVDEHDIDWSDWVIENPRG